MLARTVGGLVGPGAAGKSTLIIHLISALATGRPLLGNMLPPTGAGKVLAIFAEEDETLLHHRFRDIRDELFPFGEGDQLLSDNLLLIPAAGHDLRMLATSPEGAEATKFFDSVIEAVSRIQDLRLIVFDPIARISGVPENNNELGTVFVTLLEQIAIATGAAVITTGHVSKRAAIGSGGEFDLDLAMSQDAGRGASAIPNAMRWQANLFGLPEKAEPLAKVPLMCVSCRIYKLHWRFCGISVDYIV